MSPLKTEHRESQLIDAVAGETRQARGAELVAGVGATAIVDSRGASGRPLREIEQWVFPETPVPYQHNAAHVAAVLANRLERGFDIADAI